MFDDLLATLFEEHFCDAPEKLKNKLYGAVSPNVAGDALVHLSRVRFESHRFDVDEDGQWAVVLPVFEDGAIVDFGAFSVDDDKLRRPYSFVGAVGFECALRDAYYHPERRLLLHYDVWSFLRTECVGCLPISWRKTALALIENDIRELILADDIQAAKAHQLLANAVRPPRLFVLKSREAA